MSIDQQASQHPIARFSHRANEVLDDVCAAPTWTLTADDARVALMELTRLQDRVAALRLRVLATADALDVGADTGCTSTAAWLADRTVTTRPRAHADLALAKRLDDAYAATREALATGALHEEHARVIVSTVEALPREVGPGDRQRAERHLVDLAKQFDAVTLRRLGRRIFEVIAPDEADRREGEALEREEAAARRRTVLRIRDNGDGTWSGSFRVSDLHAAMLRTALHALSAPRRRRVDPSVDEAGPGVSTTTPELMGAAFTELLERLPVDRLPVSGGINATVVVTMTLEQLRDGLGAAGLTTGEAISAAEARRLACRAGIIPAVLGGASQVLDLGRRRRLHSRAQRIALDLQSRGCTAEGCDRPAGWCEAHHEVPWSEGGGTSVRQGRLLCPRHHHLAHDTRYEATHLADGRVRFHRRT
jgi:hypothetical protein